MYLLVLCPRCRAARVTPDVQKTTTCVRCGRLLAVADHAKGRAGSVEEAQEMLGALHAKLAGDAGAYEDALAALAKRAPRDAHDDAPSRAAARARGARGEVARADETARALSREGTFDAGTFAAAMEKQGTPGERALALLARLVAGSRVAEPCPGRYRSV